MWERSGGRKLIINTAVFALFIDCTLSTCLSHPSSCVSDWQPPFVCWEGKRGEQREGETREKRY
jgi:hypothetical protein